MHQSNGEARPKLRAVEAVPAQGSGGREMYAVRDPSGIARCTLTLSAPALFIVAHFDGRHTLEAVAEAFESRFGQPVAMATLMGMVEKLDEGLMLDGPRFHAHIEGLTRAYREAATRPAVYGAELGDRETVMSLMNEMIPLDGAAGVAGRLVGLVAPHLDYPRGWSCYGEAYASLVGAARPTRVCVLGTNHFGRSAAVVATGKAFETPLGVTHVDTVFLERVERRSGFDLRAMELDHLREHSVELQVMCLQHVLGAGSFRIVPFLCPDPCGPTGTKPYDGVGVDMREFVDALAAELADEDEPTLLVAGADLSHVGSQFGDAFEIDEAFLVSVGEQDRGALAHLESGDSEAFMGTVANAGNPTRICSVGCMYVVASVLRDATPTLLRYHQAYNEEQQICVSCSAMTYVA